MNSKIKPLDQSEVLKIAAGEVIVRPASVVKELVENAIDSGAKNIFIKIEQAGKSLIQVKDDGCGMSLEDCKNSVLIHWTSKISSFSDLSKISSLGFRGEALASISAISDLTIKTRELGSEKAWEVSFRGQEVADCKSAKCEPGTTLVVKNLFGNVPARLKFLKQNKTEEGQIVSLIESIAAINFKIGISLEVDSKLVLDLPAVKNKKERIVQIMGLEVGQKLFEVNHSLDGVDISGFVSSSTLTRYSRNYIWLSANGRPVRDVKVCNALIAGYSRMLEMGKFPMAFLAIDLPGEQIDFNVHPCKEEVHFQNYSAICNQVKEAVSNALGLNSDPFNNFCQQKKEAEFKIDNYSEFFTPSVKCQPSIDEPFKSTLKSEEVVGSKTFDFICSKVEQAAVDHCKIDLVEKVFQEKIQQPCVQEKVLFSPQGSVEKHFQTQISPLSSVATEKAVEGTVVAQLFQTIIVVAHDQYVLMIDQHAAHERILYQRAIDGSAGLLKNRLLCPEIFDFWPQELELIMGYQHAFSYCGFGIEPLGKDKLVLKASPVGLGLNFVSGIFKEFLNFVSSNELAHENIEESIKFFLFSQISCKSAVKAGDSLSTYQMENIYKDLINCANNAQCIHGRPTMWKLEKADVLKNFKRSTK